ncbi:MAG: NAD(P)-dependent oxidoreductase [Desulfatibacillaceae bacterium]
MSTTIGFIGMGIMGSRMSRNLLDQGFPVHVYNRTANRCLPLVEAGAVRADTPADLGEQAEVVVTMLTGPEAVDSVLFGEDGLFSRNPHARVLVNMSSVPPAYSAELAEKVAARGMEFVDAPVSGSRKPAEEGTLVILASGPKAVADALESMFAAMGKKTVYCGEAGKGSAMKMAVNHLLGSMMLGLSESLNFARKCGLPAELFLGAVSGGPLNCGLFELKYDMLESGEYPAQFPLKHMLKDLRFMAETADEYGAAVPFGRAAFETYRYAMGKGMGDDDFAAVHRVFEVLNDD